MVDAYTIRVILLSGDKVYYNLSRSAVKRYISYFGDCPDYRGIEVSSERNLRRKAPNWLR